MALFGEYLQQMSAPDYHPRCGLQTGDYLPDVLLYAQGGLEVYVEEEYALDFLKRVTREDKIRQDTNNFGLGDGLI